MKVTGDFTDQVLQGLKERFTFDDLREAYGEQIKGLIDGGADPSAPNRSGSTPMLLATQNTGRGGSGSAEAKAQQQEILRLLEEHGAG